jgi:hypothetical protein
MLSKFCDGIRYASNGRGAGSFSKIVGITATWFLLGCALGLRFKILVLVPAVTSAMLGATVVGIARGDQYWFVVVAMILFMTAVSVRISCWDHYSRWNRFVPSALTRDSHIADIGRILASSANRRSAGHDSRDRTI